MLEDYNIALVQAIMTTIPNLSPLMQLVHRQTCRNSHDKKNAGAGAAYA